MIITHDLSIGGLQQVVVNICRCLDRQKFDVMVLCLNALGEFAEHVERLGIRVVLLPQRESGPDYLSFFKVAKLVREERIEIIHTHNTQALIDGAIAGLLAGVKRVVHTDHARHFPDKKRYMMAERILSHFVYKIVGVSDHTCKNLIRYEKISPKKIVMIPNGINGDKFNKNIDKLTKLREIGIENNGPIIGLGVRLVQQKGITFLLQAMPAIIKRFPAITLLIAGDGPLRNSLKEESVQLGVCKNVVFLGARLDMPEILKVLDLYVLPSLWEGLPMVILEAMAAERPVVATDVGGNSTAIKNGETGRLVAAEKPDKLANAIIDLLEKPHLKEAFARKGKKLFEEMFTAEKMTKKYELLYLGQ